MQEPAQALVNDPTAVAALLAAVVAVIFRLSTVPRLKRFFELTPPVIYVYFVPMLMTTFGVTPATSDVYGWFTRYLLPFALVLLMITVDLKSVLRLGPVALFMVVAGTVGIVIGGPIALFLFGAWLPDDAWMGFAALSGSWIGGTANMVAIAESVGTPDAMLGPVIVVDTVVGYGWMGILLFFSIHQATYDRRTGARTEAIEETNRRLVEMQSHRRPTDLVTMTILLGLGLGGAVLAVAIGDRLPVLGDPTIISHTTWAVLLVVAVGLALSFTPLRNLEEAGASHVGYAALYLLLAGIGARGDLAEIFRAPIYLAAGAVWIAIHVALLFGAARLVRAPLFFIATGSMANVGGAASAPVVAGVYHPAMAPVGLLMAVAGYILGYAGLICAWLLSKVA